MYLFKRKFVKNVDTKCALKIMSPYCDDSRVAEKRLSDYFTVASFWGHVTPRTQINSWKMLYVRLKLKEEKHDEQKKNSRQMEVVEF